jgi:hypothetical protein
MSESLWLSNRAVLADILRQDLVDWMEEREDLYMELEQGGFQTLGNFPWIIAT